MSLGGFDDVVWDPPETWADLGFTGPRAAGILIVCVLAGIMLAAPAILKKGRQRRQGYSRVGPSGPEYEQRLVA